MHCNPLSRMSQQLEMGICCFGLLESTPPLWCGLVELTTFPTSCFRSICVTQNPGHQPSSLWPQQWFTHVHLSHSRPRKVRPAILFQPFRRKNLSSTELNLHWMLAIILGVTLRNEAEVDLKEGRMARHQVQELHVPSKQTWAGLFRSENQEFSLF